MSGFISGQSSKTTVPRTVRVFTASEKLAAIQRVRAGATKASVARDIGVPESTLRGWCKNEDKIRYQASLSSPDSDNSRSKRFKLDDSPVSSRPRPRAEPQKRGSISPKFSPELNRSCSGLAPTANETSVLTESILAHWRNCHYQLMQQLPSYESSVDESVRGWLRSQEAGADKNSPPTPVVSNAGALHTNATSATCPPSFSYASGLCMNPGPWHFASFYNQLVNYHRQNQTQDTSNSESEQTSSEPQRQEESNHSQQLTENTQAPESPPEPDEAENPSTKTKKTRKMLNNLLLDNVDSDDENDENVNGVDHARAMRHAEKFMNWLTSVGTLYVTPSQLVSCETVVKNVSKDIESRMSNQLKYRRR